MSVRNTWTGYGTVSTELVLQRFPDGKDYCKFKLIVDNGDKSEFFLYVTYIDQAAKLFIETVKQFDKIFVTGRLEIVKVKSDKDINEIRVNIRGTRFDKII